MTRLETTGITAAEFEDASFQNWLGETSPELFREYLLPSNEARRILLSNRFRTLFTKADSEVRFCKRDGHRLAIMGFERLDWDSRHFGVECGRLSPYCTSSDLSSAEQPEVHRSMLGLGIDWARRNNIKVLQRRLLSSRIHEITVLEDFGFRLADNLVILAAPTKHVLSTPQIQKCKLAFRSPAGNELDVLRSMTRGAFPYSRFVNDSVLSAELGDDLYLKWLAKLFGHVTDDTKAESAGQGIILAMVDDRIAGYAVYGIDPQSKYAFGKSVATIELIVVDPAFQGMGVGQGLFREASRILNDSGVDLLESSTWINHRVSMASNQKAGLRVRENLFTYHLHL